MSPSIRQPYLQVIFLFLSVLPLFVRSGATQEEHRHYINSQADFNRYSGKHFPAGTSILFARGKTFSGQFIIRGSGTSFQPNFVGAYEPATGEIFKRSIENKPLIEGRGLVSATVLLEDGEHWDITNLEVTNSNGSDQQQGEIFGIQVTAEDVGLREYIRIAHCYVHHVNGKVGGKKTGGISINVLGNQQLTRYNNLIIEDNHVAETGGVGISNQSSWGEIHTETYYPWTNYYIRRNLVEYTGRNGIIVRYAVNPIVAYNTLAYNSRFSPGHSVFNFNTINCLVQYNEAYGNTSDDPEDIDHGGFDADYRSEGTIIQYNYSHDNNWFCGIMKKGPNKDITIRYNISQNERLGIFLYGFPTQSAVRDVKIYNNTFYSGKGMGDRVFVSTGKVRIPIQTEFKNNIFYFEEAAQWGFEPDSTCTFSNNLYYNLPPRGAGAITEPPQFRAAGSGGTHISMLNPRRLSGYWLQANSPAKSAGASIQNHGGVDFWGNALRAETTHIGAFSQ